ncbi:MAG TPA: hypothetical protein VIY90_09205 [Steroidobacteraceae bacterium]
MEIENKATIARVTCGWKKRELALNLVRPYWRDAHSPAIARRAGIYEYRHYPLDPIRSDVLPAVAGIDLVGHANEQLMWLSDVRYLDEASLEAFGRSPTLPEKRQILADIEMIVDRSTTYKVLGNNGRTLVDKTNRCAPQGPVTSPTFAVFFRQRGDQRPFRGVVDTLARHWAQLDGVLRLRCSLFEIPDMEAERASGYPVKTHPPEMQYHAWIDLVLDKKVAASTLRFPGHNEYAAHIAAIHTYTVPAVYTFNYQGRLTLVGLRGYAAHEAIESLGAEHQKNAGLLEWMYGPVARGGVSP